MKEIIISLLTLALWAGCHSQEHSHDHPEAEESGPEPLVYTLYTEKTELFVEFKPLIVGQESRFAAHFTALGDTFKAIGEGSVTLTLTGKAGSQSITADKPEVPGIFRLALTPENKGLFQLIFDIKTPEYADRVTIDSVAVYQDEKTAIMSASQGAASGSSITYLKEQAWKIDFANTPVKRVPFHHVEKTSGMVSSAPGDEQMVTAMTAGIVSLGGKSLFAGSPVTAGQTLFTISSETFTDGNAHVRLQEAKNNYERAKANHERDQKLLAGQLITQKEYLASKTEWENALALFNSLSGNYSPTGQRIKSSQSGFVKALFVSEGQFAEAGQPLAVIAKNNRLVVTAELSQTAYARMGSISSANFRVNSQKVYSLQELNGKVVSIGRSADPSLFIPVYFEVDNREGIMPGTYVEIFLQTGTLANALVLPITAILEEQGVYYCYVQTGGETFEKRELRLGGNDGIKVQVLSGIAEGERAVIKGAKNIKLSSASGTLPSHGHQH